jgi:hypothetical protein
LSVSEIQVFAGNSSKDARSILRLVMTNFRRPAGTHFPPREVNEGNGLSCGNMLDNGSTGSELDIIGMCSERENVYRHEL